MKTTFMWSLWKTFLFIFLRMDVTKIEKNVKKIHTPPLLKPEHRGCLTSYLFHCLSHNSLSFSFVISFHPVLEIIKDFGVFVMAHVLTHSIITGLGAPMQHFWRRGT